MSPKEIDFGNFRESIKLGEIQMFNNDIRYQIYSLSDQFKGNDYDIALKNCNSFSNAISQKLLGKDIPGFVNRLANIGGFFYIFFKSLFSQYNNTNKITKFNGTGYRLN